LQVHTSVAVILLALVSLPAAAADKTDIVILKVGDRITCELKEFERGRLIVKTDATDTVTVHWGHVVSLISVRSFEVESVSGLTYYGSLKAGDPGVLVVATAEGDVSLPMLDVVHLAPLERGFWSRIDGAIDLGFSYTQASEQTQWTLNSRAQHRRERYVFEGALASQFTAIEGADSTSRNSLSLSGRRLLARRWFTGVFAQGQQDESLGLNVRSVLAAIGGRYVIQQSRTVLGILSGVAYTHEQFVDEEPDNSAEALLGVQWDWFSLRNNDTDISTRLLTYYNVSGRARVRVDLTAAYKQKIVKDLHWSLNGFENYDGDPPAGQKSNDAGVSLSLGWSF
jgi:uncharacterized protein DUF481